MPRRSRLSVPALLEFDDEEFVDRLNDLDTKLAGRNYTLVTGPQELYVRARRALDGRDRRMNVASVPSRKTKGMSTDKR